MTHCACPNHPSPGHGFAGNGCLCGAPVTLAAYRRIEADLSRRELLGGLGATLSLFAGFGLAPTWARASGEGQPLLLSNLRLFDGDTLAMQDGIDVLIENGRITALPQRGQGPEHAQTIDCGGRAVIPGLIDAHWHATLCNVTVATAMTAEISYVHMKAAQEAGATLLRGFTTIRDVGGPAFGLKRAIDEGVISGPRIFPSGAMISQTSGHGDFRSLHDLPKRPDDLAYTDEVGVSAIADGADQVLLRAREQLMRGASQIKVMAGGGVASSYDPLDTVQYTERELRAAVEAAEDWNTYVCAHVYTPRAIQKCVRAGVKSIEHGQLADEETVQMMADAGVWWSLQPFLADEDSNQYPTLAQQEQQRKVAQGTVQAYEWAQKYGVPMAFGTDSLLNPATTKTQGKQISKTARFMSSPLAALRVATGENGRLLAMSGPRAPYDGVLGRIVPGAFADLLVVDGDPETDLSFLATPEATLRVVMKGGRIVKNTL
ncbi:amidohydrolase family protein [Tropicimonas sp. IMCC34043]|uniref:metal-dependent hydrolase family protein n=1 Tax=Tropicimonas sp. IMCC34043 TaxID=2248760 RepID=UPI000E258859|nr:amidohydrolase family protein [Tropicimonas sp. IMCC34043]